MAVNQRFPSLTFLLYVHCSPLPASVDIFDYPHIRELELADYDEGQGPPHDSIDVLVGSDYYWNFVTGETVRGDFGPIAVNSVFGWMLSGRAELAKFKDEGGERTSANIVISRTEDFIASDNQRDDQLIEILGQFWETETIGIKEPNEVHDCAADEGFIDDITFNGRNYEVGLPWKGGLFPGTDGYNTCYNRLQSLHRKLRTDQALLNEYSKIIREQLEGGIIERVPDTKETNESGKRVNYLPHHPVIRSDKDTTKVRVVYDGSAKISKDKESLNDCLEIGPNYTPHVFDTLIKFRWSSVGVTADIEKAFLMIGIKKSDRDALRFLWFDDPNECHPELTIYRFKRLVFGLRPSPAILGFTISHHLEGYSQSDSKLASLLKESFYVDDLVTGEESVDESFHIYKRSKQIMAEGGFNLRKWNSNSQALMKQIETHELAKRGDERSKNDKATQDQRRVSSHTSEEESYAKLTTGHNAIDPSDGGVKVLGSNWDTKADELFFNFDKWKEDASSIPATKRSLLGLTAKIFDPLGFLAPPYHFYENRFPNFMHEQSRLGRNPHWRLAHEVPDCHSRNTMSSLSTCAKMLFRCDI
jgi:hypothetical protein